MGWTILDRRPAGMTDREFVEREFPANLVEHGRIVACATKRGIEGTVFYAAVRNNSDAPRNPGETWALVVLMRRARGEFFYKAMHESEGPAEDLAPAAVLNALTPTASQYANEWRARCRASLAKAAVKVKSGDTVTFARPLTFPDGRGEVTALVFDKGSTFTRPGTPYRYQIPRWRDREYTVTPAAPPPAVAEDGPGFVSDWEKFLATVGVR